MKKTTCCLLALIGLLIALNGYTQLPVINCVPEKEFDYGNLKSNDCVYSFDAGNFISSNINFNEHFRYINEDGLLDKTPVMISIVELKNKFAAIQQDINYDPGHGDIAAMVMHFGMQGNKIFPIFQLAVMHPTNISNRYTWDTANDHFRIINGTFNSIHVDTFSKYTNAYTSPNSDIYIIHSRVSFGHKFYSSLTKFYGDVRCCTMPFQQIFKMYNDNGGDCASDAASGMVQFSIEATMYRRSLRNYKLHVVASYGSFPEDTDQNTFRGLGADFSQMSPPNNASLVLPPFKEIIAKETPVKKMK
jgi:hypothetical protein